MKKITVEIGINHNGDMSIAKNLIKKSVDAGFDIVKFQREITVGSKIFLRKDYHMGNPNGSKKGLIQ